MQMELQISYSTLVHKSNSQHSLISKLRFHFQIKQSFHSEVTHVWGISKLKHILTFAQFLLTDYPDAFLSCFMGEGNLATFKQPENEHSKHTSVTIATAQHECYNSDTADWGREADREGLAYHRWSELCEPESTRLPLNVCISQWKAAGKETSTALSNS